MGAGLTAGAMAGGFEALAPFGNRIGQYAGDIIKTYTGFGAYTANVNSLYEGAQTPQVRNFGSAQGIIVCGREYLCDLITHDYNGQFKTQSFLINPSNSSVFEWLSQIAVNYEQWVPLGILLTYTSRSSENVVGTNLQLGTVMISAQYNVTLPPFNNKAEIECTQQFMACKPSDSMVFPVECDMSLLPIDILNTKGQRDVVVHNLSVNGSVPQDPRFSDFCYLQVSTQGFQGEAVNCGEIHIAYEIALMKPRLFASLGYGIDQYWAYSTDPTGGHVLGQTLDIIANIVVPRKDDATTVVLEMPRYPQPMKYMIEYNMTVSGTETLDLSKINCTQDFSVYNNNVVVSGVVSWPSNGTNFTGNAKCKWFANYGGGLFPNTLIFTNFGFVPSTVSISMYEVPGYITGQ